jgi:hypothetical protein
VAISCLIFIRAPERRSWQPNGPGGASLMIDIIRCFVDNFILTTSLRPISPPAVWHLKAHPESPLDGSCKSACSIELTSVIGGVGRIVPMRGEPQH